MYQEFETRHDIANPTNKLGMAMQSSTIPTADGQPRHLTPSDVMPYLVGTPVNIVEQELVLQTLAYCDGNRTHAARILGLSVRTLRNKIRLYLADGLHVPAHS